MLLYSTTIRALPSMLEMASLSWEYIGFCSKVSKQTSSLPEAQQKDGGFVEGTWQGLRLILLQWSGYLGECKLWGLGATFPSFRDAGPLILL